MELRFNPDHETKMIEDNGKKYITGYASVFNKTYAVPAEGIHEKINPNAFNRSLASGRVVESRYNHSKDHVLGNTDLGSLTLWTDKKGLRYKVPFNEADPDHQKVKAKIDSGLIKGSSFAFQPTQLRFTRDGDRDICEVMECELFEVGPVNNPISDATEASVRSSDDKGLISEQYKNWKATQDRIEKFKRNAI